LTRTVTCFISRSAAWIAAGNAATFTSGTSTRRGEGPTATCRWVRIEPIESEARAPFTGSTRPIAPRMPAL